MIDLKINTTLARNACMTFAAIAILGLTLNAPAHAAGSAGAIYNGSLQNGWQSWPWAKVVKLDNKTPVHSGGSSILVMGGGWQALSLNRTKTSSAGFKTLSFWVYTPGPTTQPLKVVGLTNNKAQKTVVLTPIAPGKWSHISIALKDLGVANKPDLTGFWLQDASGKGITIVLDSISLM